ncbi:MULTISPECIES: hypothetical protein [Burkholderia]|uniref:hypothetical protein n=1 Tax=Burkholderia TaxID=32008 RepID=UPI000CFF8F79|nr:MULTISPECIES: hypothetical protein [Burkholderia]MBJ9665277.1 hypothetical protein [Burkholderia gladioli]MDN7741306.1 hypothetical protein [Burkholderia gladioli]PRE91219.1 hypothetical protein C6Q13_03145 [Burkholderia gladioli]TWC62249.1 hypothetical protein FB600_121119 [Burkholderia sp. SJZ089]TWC95634.1 hypothetical protein FBX98_121119 [Burkholderia sp. SJZ115]
MKKFLIGASMVPLLAAAANFVHASDAQLSRLSAPAAQRDRVQAQLVDAWLRGVSAADEKQTYPSPPEYRRFISMRRCHYARLHPDRRYTGVVAADCGKAIS